MKQLLCLLMLLNPFVLHAQQQQDSSIFHLYSYAQNVASFNRQNPQEKVYLHFDNSYYHAGETIWFKAYVVSTDKFRVMDYSRVLYIDLVSPEGETVKTVKLKIENGQCHGNIILRDTLFPGYYEVRAYTQAMLNFGTIRHKSPKPNIAIDKSMNPKTAYTYREVLKAQMEEEKSSELKAAKAFEDFIKNVEEGEVEDSISDRGFLFWDTLPYLDDFYLERNMREYGSVYSRVFPVYNKLSKNSDYSREMTTRPSLYPPKKIKSNLVVRFYPEGGHLVFGHPSIIAFEARNEQGNLVDIEGQIIECSGRELTSFKTTHSGKGMFYLQMDSISWEENKGCLNAVIKYEDKKYIFPLSPTLKQGYTMRINNLRKKAVLISLEKSLNYDSKLVGITIQSGGELYYSRIIATDTILECHLSIARASLPTGVNQITLFDVEGAVLAERLIFINHGEYERNQFKVTGMKKAYDAHEAVDLEFLIKDSISGKPIEATFSLSVTDNDYPHEGYSAGNALTSLLLSSEIHGFIENPEYYFEKNDMIHSYNLDLLLRVQGWRRYSWQEMARVKPFLKLYELERSFILEGDVFNISRRKASIVPEVKVEAHLFIDSLEIGGVDTTDNEGHFRFDIGEFMGEAIVSVIAEGERPKRKRAYRADYDQRYLIPIYGVHPCIPKQYSFYEKNLMPNSKSFNDIINSLPTSTQYVLDEATVTKKRRVAQRYSLDKAIPIFRLDVQKERNKGIDLGVNWTQKNDWFFPTLHALKLRGKLTYREFEDELMNPKMIDIPSIYYNYLQVSTSENAVNKGPITSLDRHLRFTTSRLKEIEIFANINLRDRYVNPLDSDWKETIYINMNTDPDSNYYYPELPGRRTSYQGYSYISEFYSPDYSQMTPPKKSDRRRTLYWNPSVKTDSTGRANVQFYNSSTCRYMHISAETVTTDGKPIILKK